MEGATDFTTAMEHRKVLVIGAGRVAGPCVGFLLKKNHEVTIASPVQSELDKITSSCPGARALLLDSQNDEELTRAVLAHRVVVGLVPTHLQAQIASTCVQHGRHFLSASYASPEMTQLHDRAVSAGVTLLLEMGLDPGIDHAIAMSCIDTIKAKGGTVTSFFSVCGGLPRPEDSQCPMRYKFSWYPKGMLISAMAPATYLKDKEIVKIPSGRNFSQPGQVKGLVEGEVLELLANRDSLGYIDLYAIPTAHSVYRGTLRYQGFSNTMRVLIQLGLLNDDEENPQDRHGRTWKEFTCQALLLPPSSSVETIRAHLLPLAGNVEASVDDVIRLGVCEDVPMPGLPTAMDDLTDLLQHRLEYGPGEKDLVAMRVEVEASYPQGLAERHTVDLVVVGHRETAMATTVGIPAGLGAHLLLQGQLDERGVALPTIPAVYTPLLSAIESEGIQLKYRVETI